MKQIKLRLKFDRYIYFSKINKEMYTILNYQYLTADPKLDAFIDEITTIESIENRSFASL